MTRILLDKELHDLDAQLMRLGSLVDTALAQALEAVETGDQDKAGIVVVSDAPIDDLHLAIEEHSDDGETHAHPDALTRHVHHPATQAHCSHHAQDICREQYGVSGARGG